MQPGAGVREREREREMESGGKRGGDIGGYMWENQKVQGPSINKQITVCQDSRDLCALIFAHAAEFNHGDCLSNAPAYKLMRSPSLKCYSSFRVRHPR